MNWYEIHPGPYGVGTSRKAVIQGLNDSLKRLQLDYVDIYYAHRFDDTVDLEETVNALDQTVRDGKALYIGISNFDTFRRLVVGSGSEWYSGYVQNSSDQPSHFCPWERRGCEEVERVKRSST